MVGDLAKVARAASGASGASGVVRTEGVAAGRASRAVIAEGVAASCSSGVVIVGVVTASVVVAGETGFTAFEVIVDVANTAGLVVVTGETSVAGGAGGTGGTSGTGGVTATVVVTSQSFFGLKTKLVEGGGELLVVLAWWAVILLVSTVLATAEDTSCLVELVECLHGQGRKTVVLGSGVVSFMDRLGGVHNLWLDDLLVDHGHDCLVDMMVDVLASDGRGSGLSVVGFLDTLMVLEVTEFGSESLLGLMLVLVVEFSFFGGQDVVGMLLRKSFLVRQRLNGGVVVMLMNLTVNSLGGFLVEVRLDGLSSDGGVDRLIDGGVVAPVAGDLVDGGSSCFHLDGLM